MNGTILGMTKREIDRKFDEIVDFSGVEKFLDTPTKRYSSGMQVRLAFAVAAHLEPEILIIDEVLAVGDAEFQKKCLGKMQDVASKGRTVLFVSHHMPMVRSLTTSCIYMKAGMARFMGTTPETIDYYLNDSVRDFTSAKAGLDAYRRDTCHNADARFIGVRFGDVESAAALPVIESGNSIQFDLEFECERPLDNACISVVLFRGVDERAITLYTRDRGFAISADPGRHKVHCQIDGLPLTPGRYTATIGLNRNAQTKASDVLLNVPAFEVVMSDVIDGTLHWTNRPWGAIHWKGVTWQCN